MSEKVLAADTSAKSSDVRRDFSSPARETKRETRLAMIPRDIAQDLITKLDLKAISPAAAKSMVGRYYRVEVRGRTREQVAREIGQLSEARA